MSTTLQPPPVESPAVDLPRNSALQDEIPVADTTRRSYWRRRLIDVERGMSRGFRRDSSLSAYVFCMCMTVCASLVLGISLLQWTVVILATSMVFTAELFRLAISALHTEDSANEAIAEANCIARAAVFFTVIGGIVATCLIFGQRVMELWH